MPDDTLKIYPEAVKAIKSAILRSRYLAARLANAEQLKLYFGIGGYVSANTRQGKWGTGAIESISRALQAELPGLRGFSPSSMKYMRLFFEAWSPFFSLRMVSTSGAPVNRQSLIDDLSAVDFTVNRQTLSGESASGANRQTPIDDLTKSFPLAGKNASASGVSEADRNAFLSVGFSQHMEILFKCGTAEERWYYIRQSAEHFWSVRVLRNHLAADDFRHAGALPNNFALALPDERQAARAVRSFKDEYLLDFINIEDVGGEDDVDERSEEAHV